MSEQQHSNTGLTACDSSYPPVVTLEAFLPTDVRLVLADSRDCPWQPGSRRRCEGPDATAANGHVATSPARLNRTAAQIAGSCHSLIALFSALVSAGGWFAPGAGLRPPADHERELTMMPEQVTQYLSNRSINDQKFHQSNC
jgi:hypothetical protein